MNKVGDRRGEFKSCTARVRAKLKLATEPCGEEGGKVWHLKFHSFRRRTNEQRVKHFHFCPAGAKLKLPTVVDQGDEENEFNNIGDGFAGGGREGCQGRRETVEF